MTRAAIVFLHNLSLCTAVAWIAAAAEVPFVAACAVAAAERPNAGSMRATGELEAPHPGAAHWAFQSLRKPEPPAVTNESWIRTPIDRFVLAELEAASLEPSPPADRRTLLRRLSVHLTGLPPAFDELDAFAADSARDAFDRAVDRLLESHEFGQRWARHWLDVARYADTTGYIEGGEVRYPFAYTYRDYVVRSLNEDVPFDRFVVEQLAADRLELPDEERWKLAAMGFLTVGPRFNYNRHEVIDDRIDVITRGLLGLSVACARCHDHKYDPVPMDDYYSLYGMLAGSVEPLYTDLPRIAESGGSFAEYRRFRETVAKRTQQLEQFHAATQRKIQHEMRSMAGEYLWYVVQMMPEHRTQTQISFETKRGLIRGPTPYGPGGIVRWQHYIATRAGDDPVFGLWNRMAKSPREQFGDRLGRILDELPATNRRLRDALTEELPQSMVELARLYGRLLERSYEEWRQLTDGDPAATMLPDPAAEELRQVLFAADSPVAMNEYEAHDCYSDGEFNRYMGLKRELDATFVKHMDVAEPRAMVLRDRSEPYAARVLDRGNATRPGQPVPIRLPAVLANGDDRIINHGSGRLELAQAITRSDSAAAALAARVFVNRVWLHLFGAGLVRTPSDFGLRGDFPSHPELLEFLAAQFIQNGWSTKKLIRLIVQSSVYQQESKIAWPESDPENRLLSGVNRRRLDLESLRDKLLAVSGRLDRKLDGPPTADLASPRRSIYLLIDRNRTPAVFGTFDFPNPDISSPMRPETTVPQQALYIMNSQFLDEVVSNVLNLLEDHAGPTASASQIGWLYRRVLGREPNESEMNLGLAFLRDAARSPTALQLDQKAEPPDIAPAGDDESPAADPRRDTLRLYVHALLMLNEFAYVE